MGATEFTVTQVVKGDANLAYREAYSEARDYNGHQEGYSGDIQTVEGYREEYAWHPQVGSKAFTKWLDDKISDMDKRDCRFIELTGIALKRAKERQGLKGRKGYRAFMFYGMAAC
jgi:hypothetical protein